MIFYQDFFAALFSLKTIFMFHLRSFCMSLSFLTLSKARFIHCKKYQFIYIGGILVFLIALYSPAWNVYYSSNEAFSLSSNTTLGIILSNDGSWHLHIECIKIKAWSRVNLLKKLRFRLDRRSLEITYFTFIRPILEYADVVWDNCTMYKKMI